MLGKVRHTASPHSSCSHQFRDQGVLSLLHNPPHGVHCLHRELAHGTLTAQHDSLSTVQDGVCHVACLCAGREGLVLHGCQHLRGTNGIFTSRLGLLQHHLLSHPHFLHRDLHAQISARHHDAIGLRQDLLEVLQALHVFDLGDHLDVLAFAVLPALLDVVSALNEAQGDVIGVVWHGPFLDVLDLPLTHHRDLHLDTWDIHVLLLTQLAVVHHLAHDIVLTALLYNEDHSAILNQDALALLHTLRQLRVGDGHHVFVALLLVICHQLEVLASLQLLLGVVHLKGSGANFRASGVHQDLHLALELRGQFVGLLQVGQLHALLLMVAVRHVAADHVHASLHQLHQDLWIPRLGANGADDVCLLLLVVHLGNFLKGGRILHGLLLKGFRCLAHHGALCLTSCSGGGCTQHGQCDG
mmetsp:Transcript_61230/g.134083  ORF Transcript_61230/g.134083 Transcript_61230/m.134083 type:complete len:413 (-) Transcript_61230:242-1480(-)